MKVLIIDDDDIARELLCSTLRDAGHETFELESAVGAVRCIQEGKVDAVVLDVMLPAINGDRLARMLRDNPRGDRLAIVLVSSRSAKELQAMAIAAQADEVVPKDEVRRNLAGAVLRAVKRRAAPSASSY